MSEQRKSDHIALTFKSRPKLKHHLGDLHYEPLLSAHLGNEVIAKKFLGKNMGMPLWISSMTGGTEQAKLINTNLAKACKQFELGMGLGSCRPLLESNDRFEDFNLRPIIGDRPLYSNFGIAQLEQLIEIGKLDKLKEINNRLEVDGMVIHVNPLQEWAQKEGDRFKRAPIDTINIICDNINSKIIVKEAGQGFGPKSLKSLCELPIAAIELAGFGGTNFTMLEQTRLNGDASGKNSPSSYMANIGHTPSEMVDFLNQIRNESNIEKEIIISGGIVNPIDGHILMEKLNMNSIVGMASEFLKYAMLGEDELYEFIEELKECFKTAKAFIK